MPLSRWTERYPPIEEIDKAIARSLPNAKAKRTWRRFPKRIGQGKIVFSVLTIPDIKATNKNSKLFSDKIKEVFKIDLEITWETLQTTWKIDPYLRQKSLSRKAR